MQEVANDTEIQIKWQAREARALTVYHLGDVLDDIEAEYNDRWIRTDYSNEGRNNFPKLMLIEMRRFWSNGNLGASVAGR